MNMQIGGLSTLLTVAFVVMKLLHVIAWSWLWVLAPLWISIILGAILAIVVVTLLAKNL